MELPKDILDYINNTFLPKDRKEIKEDVELYIKDLNTFGILLQAARALVFLANGNKEIFYYYLNNYDPRDIVYEGEEKTGNLGHWFQISLDELGNPNKKTKTPLDNIDDNANLPF